MWVLIMLWTDPGKQRAVAGDDDREINMAFLRHSHASIRRGNLVVVREVDVPLQRCNNIVAVGRVLSPALASEVCEEPP